MRAGCRAGISLGEIFFRKVKGGDKGVSGHAGYGPITAVELSGVPPLLDGSFSHRLANNTMMPPDCRT